MHAKALRKTAIRFSLFFLLGISLNALNIAPRVSLTSAVVPKGTTITVDTYDDELGDGGGDCSLREAIQAVNSRSAVDGCPAGSGDDTIILRAGTYVFTLRGAGEDRNASGDLDVLEATLTISGDGAGTTIIDGNQHDRVLHVHAGATVTINGVKITNGKTPDGGMGANGGDGGGIYNAGELTLDSSSVTGNASGIGGSRTVDDAKSGDGGAGAGVFNAGTLTLINSTLSGNFSGGGGGTWDSVGGSGGPGGGIYNSGTLAMINSAVIDNTTGNGGFSSYSGGDGGDGGGVYNAGTLKADDSIITGNTTGSGADGHNGHAGDGGSGGGIYNEDRMELAHCTVVRNTTGDGGGGNYGASAGDGGGIYSYSAATVTNSNISGNTTGNGGYSYLGPNLNFGGDGGGILNRGAFELFGSTVANNATGDGGSDPDNVGSNGGSGGGIYNSGQLAVTNSTVSSNTTGAASGGESGVDGYGGGIYSRSTLTLNDATVADNAAGTTEGNGKGGGISTLGTVQVKNTIIAGNRDLNGDGDCYHGGGSFDSLGHNLVEVPDSCTFSATGDVTGKDPRFGSLSDNGGDTLTHALLPDSPAIDQGSCNGTASDQRGQLRPVDIPTIANAAEGCDIGAYEYQGPRLSVTKAASHTVADAGKRITYTITVTNGGDFEVTEITVSDTLPAGVTLAGPVTIDPPGAGKPGTPPTLIAGLTLEAGEQIRLTVPVFIKTSVAQGSSIVNTALVTSPDLHQPITSSVAVTVGGAVYLPLCKK